MLDSVATLLDSLSLEHLHDSLDAEDLAAWRDMGRVALLSRLKECGVSKLVDRQAVANGFSKAQRLGELPAPPPPPLVPPVPVPPAPRNGRKGRILCLHGGSSSGEIMKIQLTRFLHTMGEDYEFCFVNAPQEQPLDPSSPQARILNVYFEGLPVLRWMRIVDKETGEDAAFLGRGIEPTAERKDKSGMVVNLLERAEALQRMHGKLAGIPATNDTNDSGAQDAARAGSPGYGKAAAELRGETHAYREADLALRKIGEFVRDSVAQHGPFDGAIGFSQGANILTMWLALVEAGVLDAEWASFRWACCICATQWGWQEDFDARADELATGMGAGAGARTAREVQQLAAAGKLPRAAPSKEPPVRLERLFSAGPLGIPSIHLVGEKDPSKPLSYATSAMFADQPTAATSAIFGLASGTKDDAHLGDVPGTAGPIRVIIEHPNDHMPPRQKEIVAAVAEFAQRFSPRIRAAELS